MLRHESRNREQNIENYAEKNPINLVGFEPVPPVKGLMLEPPNQRVGSPTQLLEIGYKPISYV